MKAAIIDGKLYANALRQRLRQRVARLKTKHGVVPGLAVVLIGEDPASQVYVRNKAKATKEAGLHSIEHRLPATTAQAELMALLARLNAD